MFPWYEIGMLNAEAVSVVGKRVAKVCRGGQPSLDEISLMFSEKLSAVLAANVDAMYGASAAHIVGTFREAVARNEARLSRELALL